MDSMKKLYKNLLPAIVLLILGGNVGPTEAGKNTLVGALKTALAKGAGGGAFSLTLYEMEEKGGSRFDDGSVEPRSNGTIFTSQKLYNGLVRGGVAGFTSGLTSGSTSKLTSGSTSKLNSKLNSGGGQGEFLGREIEEIKEELEVVRNGDIRLEKNKNKNKKGRGDLGHDEGEKYYIPEGKDGSEGYYISEDRDVSEKGVGKNIINNIVGSVGDVAGGIVGGGVFMWAANDLPKLGDVIPSRMSQWMGDSNTEKLDDFIMRGAVPGFLSTAASIAVTLAITYPFGASDLTGFGDVAKGLLDGTVEGFAYNVWSSFLPAPDYYDPREDDPSTLAKIGPTCFRFARGFLCNSGAYVVKDIVCYVAVVGFKCLTAIIPMARNVKKSLYRSSNTSIKIKES
jgi:hypothetical protein